MYAGLSLSIDTYYFVMIVPLYCKMFVCGEEMSVDKLLVDDLVSVLQKCQCMLV